MTLLDTRRPLITEPGVYDLTAEEYHADPVEGGSVSSTVLRMLLRDGGPALVQHYKANPRHSAAFDFGGAAHRMVLGRGDEIVEVPFPDWRKAAAQDIRDAARADGKRPLLSKDVRRAEALADAIRAHPTAGPLFDGTVGVSERTVVWQDDQTGLMCRAMLDTFPHLDVPGPRPEDRIADPDDVPVAADLKTTETVSDRKLARKVIDFGYEQQDDFYRTGLASIGVVDVDFVFVFASTTEPFLVACRRLSPEFLERGRRRNRRALDHYAWCLERKTWAGLSPEITDLTPPVWATYDEQD